MLDYPRVCFFYRTSWRCFRFGSINPHLAFWKICWEEFCIILQLSRCWKWQLNCTHRYPWYSMSIHESTKLSTYVFFVRWLVAHPLLRVARMVSRSDVPIVSLFTSCGSSKSILGKKAGVTSLGSERSIFRNEKRAPGCLGYIGDEILPSYIGIIINHYKDPY